MRNAAVLSGRGPAAGGPVPGQARPMPALEQVVAPLAVVVLVALAHVWLASHMRAPIVEADEFGYLYGAHFLALGGPRPATAACTAVCGAGSYYPGYSLLLAPLWLISQLTSTVYHTALGVNSALAAVGAWLCYVLAGRLAPGLRPAYRAVIAAVVAAYPPYLLFGTIVESENLLIPAYLGTCILAHRAFSRRCAGQRAAPTWAGLGLAGGLLYMVHPSALAITAAVAAVGAWVAISPGTGSWRRRPSVAALASLVAGLAVGLVASQALVAYVTKGGSSDSGGLASALGRDLSPHGLAHLGVNTAGQLLYLLAVTAGLVVLAVPLLARALAATVRTLSDRGQEVSLVTQSSTAYLPTVPGDPARQATLALVAVTSLIMLATSVVSLGTSGAGRLDITFYGRYNEAVLAPVLVAGVLAGLDLARRGGARRGGAGRGGAHQHRARGSHHLAGVWVLGGGLAALAITAGAVAAARGGVIHGTPQATNILAAQALFRSGPDSSLSLAALAGLGAAVLVLVTVAFRLNNLLLAAAIAVACFVPSASAGLSDLAAQSRSSAGEEVIPSTLVALATRFGATSNCVGFDTSGAPASGGFSYFNYRLYDPTQSFAPFASAGGGRPCSAEVVSGVADLSARLAGAREVLGGNGTGLALWVLPGSLQARLAAAGWLYPPAGPGALVSSARAARVALAPGQAPSVSLKEGSVVTVRLSITHLGGGEPWPDVSSLGADDLAVRVEASYGPGPGAVVGDLPASVLPGQTVTADVSLGAGSLEPGRHLVTLSLTQQGVGPLGSGPASRAELVLRLSKR